MVPLGAAYTNINIYGAANPVGFPSFALPVAEAVGYFESLYRQFVTDPVERAGFRSVLLTLAHDPFATCTTARAARTVPAGSRPGDWASRRPPPLGYERLLATARATSLGTGYGCAVSRFGLRQPGFAQGRLGLTVRREA